MAAVTDAYATAAEYKARVGQSGSGSDTEIAAILAAVSRLLDQRTERFFTVDASDVVRLYDGSKAVPRTANAEDLGLFSRSVASSSDGTRLYIDDLSASPTSVKVDLNADYDYSDDNETLTEGTHFWCGPANADKGPEPKPYRFLDIVPGNGRLARWPDQLRSVQVTGKFGWPAVPGAIREATIMVTRELFDLEKGGFTLTVQNVDQAVNLAPKAFSIVRDIEERYGRRIPFV